MTNHIFMHHDPKFVAMADLPLLHVAKKRGLNEFVDAIKLHQEEKAIRKFYQAFDLRQVAQDEVNTRQLKAMSPSRTKRLPN